MLSRVSIIKVYQGVNVSKDEIRRPPAGRRRIDGTGIYSNCNRMNEYENNDLTQYARRTQI